jgi:membrane protein YdbS with pleckstrin-like domain
MPDGLPPDPDQRPARAALLAWMLGGAVMGIAAIVIVFAVFGRRDDALETILVIAACAFAVLTAVVVPLLRYRTWRYAVRAEEIDLRHGIFVMRRTIVPLARVQHVDTSVTPLGRLFGIASLTVHTAAGGHEIPGLAAPVADRLRTQIAAGIREPDDV